MQTILPPKSAAQKLCPAARYEAGPYRWTQHCLRVPCEAGALLYHTMTGELLLLSSEEAGQAEGEGPLRQRLIEHRYLVPAVFDEYEYARQFRKVGELMTKKRKEITAFTVFTTTDCNARCFYCYELGRPRLPMSERVARDAAAYIAKVSGGKEVKLTWFGGEPLYNAGVIDIIVDELRSRGVPFHAGMVSNGYLFDKETIRKAKEDWALRWVQITLDGTEEQYNHIKGFIYRDGSAYRRVLGNIEGLLAVDIQVSIRLNANGENMDDLALLTDELANRFQGQRKLTAYSVLLRDFGPNRTHPERIEETQRRWDTLQRRILDSGIGGVKRLSRSLQTNGCMADNDSCLTILPDGRLGKCEHESERLLVGSIYDGVTDETTAAHWKERIEVPECRECPFAPSCIRLRLCSWNNDQCTDEDRARIRLSVSQSILNEYRKYLSGETNKGEITDESEADVAFSGFGR